MYLPYIFHIFSRIWKVVSVYAFLCVLGGHLAHFPAHTLPPKTKKFTPKNLLICQEMELLALILIFFYFSGNETLHFSASILNTFP